MMIVDLFNTEKRSFGPATDPFRLKEFKGFIERSERLSGDGAWILFQINKRHERCFVTFCTENKEHCYISMNPDGKDVLFHHCQSGDYIDDEISKEKLFEMIEEASPCFVEWFLFNIVGIETEGICDE